MYARNRAHMFVATRKLEVSQRTYLATLSTFGEYRTVVCLERAPMGDRLKMDSCFKRAHIMSLTASHFAQAEVYAQAQVLCCALSS